MMLFVASSFAGYSYGSRSESGNTAMEMECGKSCCTKMNHQQKKSSQKDSKHACCNNSICSPLSSCNYFLISYPSELLKSFGIEAAKPRLQIQNFVLNKFINSVFQPPEVNLIFV